MELVHPPKPRPGDKVAILSPASAAPAVAPELHERALQRFAQLTRLEPVDSQLRADLGHPRASGQPTSTRPWPIPGSARSWPPSAGTIK